MPDVMDFNQTTTATTSGDITFLIVAVGGFVLFTIIVLGIFWLIETRGNRLFTIKNGVMRKIRFEDKEVSPEGFLKIKGRKEAVKIFGEPVNLRNFFGSTNPSWFQVDPYPITLSFSHPDSTLKYPHPALVYEGINNVIMRELQTYQVEKNKGDYIGMLAVGGILGLFGGFLLAGMM